MKQTSRKTNPVKNISIFTLLQSMFVVGFILLLEETLLCKGLYFSETDLNDRSRWGERLQLMLMENKEVNKSHPLPNLLLSLVAKQNNLYAS